MEVLFWTAFGAAIGYVAARHRSFSPITGVVAGLVLGPLAVVLFYIPLNISNSGHGKTRDPKKCPYCAGRVASDARVCMHCGAILQSGWG